MPRTRTNVTPKMQDKIRRERHNGKSVQEIASKMKISPSTVFRYGTKAEVQKWLAKGEAAKEAVVSNGNGFAEGELTPDERRIKLTKDVIIDQMGLLRRLVLEL